MKKTTLRNYAQLIVEMGANVQAGQEVVIQAQPDQPEFVRYVVEAAYRAGASRVLVDWDYQPLTALHVKYRSVEGLSTIEAWELEKMKHRVKALPAMIYLVSEDPDGLKGMNQAKHAQALQNRYPTIKPLRDEMENKYQWCIAGVPGKDWAKKMFPGIRTASSVEYLWKVILRAARAEGDDPIAAWRAHNENLHRRCAYLNSLGIQTLEYNASNGTDLRVGLIEDALFLGGREETLGGTAFNANIPSEEVFVSPKRGEAEGIVYATRPLSYRGKLIENFFFRFEGGRVVQAHAEKNDDLLQTMIAMDEGAAFLGECALVPYDSPIRKIDMLFYNTLFDENASCHLALGAGFTNCIKDYGSYSLEQCRAKGINDSMIHEDFMIGTQDLSITAHTRSGASVPIFRDGGWAF